MRPSARLSRGDLEGPFAAWRQGAEQRMETAALIATDQAARRAVNELRAQMAGAGLGRLGQGLGMTSDLQKGRGVYRRPGGGFSASGIVYVRSRSARTRGAIESYTQGASITPRRGRWLWFQTDELPRLTGRFRMTPELYRKNGFETKIGPLVKITADNGNPLLIVRNVGVSMAGKRRSAKSLTKKGLPRKGQMAMEFIVAFVGIPNTSRAARIDALATLRSVQADLPHLFNQALGRN